MGELSVACRGNSHVQGKRRGEIDCTLQHVVALLSTDRIK